VRAASELPIPNLFLASLSEDDFESLRPHFETVRLSLRMILHEIGEPIEHCYFTDGGMTSLLVALEDGAMIEAGVVGKEGFWGAPALMGFQDSSPFMSMIQMPGVGLRIPSDVLRTEMLHRPGLLDRVLRFTQVLNAQIAHTAACNAHHNLPERLARWLLMAHDRAESDALPLTQEFVSMMLAVRRPGVTVAARSLQATGAIDYERGRITVLDRQRLEEASCECYGIVRGHYRRVLGWPDKQSEQLVRK
jgi:CRP-like cAMP-binding protein